jgi:hypothetical protein
MQRVLIAAIGAITLGAVVNGAPARADVPLWEALEPAISPAVLIQPAPKYLDLIKSYGPSGSPSGNGNGNGNGGIEFGESEINSLGCLVGGSVGMGAALAIGGINISNLIAGGIVPAANPAALYASLFGVVFATFCAVGQAMTPVAVYTYRRYVEEPVSEPLMLRGPAERAVTPGGLRQTIAETR